MAPTAVTPRADGIELTLLNGRFATPLAGAQVEVLGEKFWQRSYLTSDVQGEVRLPARLPLVFQVTQRGYAPEKRSIEVRPEGGQLRVELLPYIRLSGHVTVPPIRGLGMPFLPRVSLMVTEAATGQETQLRVRSPAGPQATQGSTTVAKDGIWSMEFLPLVGGGVRPQVTGEIEGLRVVLTAGPTRRELAAFEVVRAGDELEVIDPWAEASPWVLEFVDQGRRPLASGGWVRLYDGGSKLPFFQARLEGNVTQVPAAVPGAYRYEFAGRGVPFDSAGVIEGAIEHRGAARSEVVVGECASITGRVAGWMQPGGEGWLLRLAVPGGAGPRPKRALDARTTWLNRMHGAISIQAPLDRGGIQGEAQPQDLGLAEVSVPFAFEPLAAGSSFDLLLLRVDGERRRAPETLLRLPVQAGDTDIKVIVPGAGSDK